MQGCCQACAHGPQAHNSQRESVREHVASRARNTSESKPTATPRAHTLRPDEVVERATDLLDAPLGSRQASMLSARCTR